MAGLLVSFQWATAQIGNRKLRMNGRHSSTMLTELDGSFPDNLVAHIDNYDVADEKGLALLFRQFDDRKSGRTPADVAGAYQGLYEPLREIPKKIAKVGVQGVAWWRRTIESVPTPANDDVYSLMAETGLHSFLRWLPEIFNVKTPEMQVEAVLGAMYATHCQRAWSPASSGPALPATASLMMTRRRQPCSTPVAQRASKTRGLAEFPDPGCPDRCPKYQGCIYAWNAYRKNQSLSEIKFNTSKGFNKVVA